MSFFLSFPRANRTPPIHAAFVALILAALAGQVAASDAIVRRDGSRLEGDVVGVDAAFVTIETDGGVRRVPRSDVATIHFGSPAPPLRVEIRNVRSDDSLDAFLDDEPVIVGAREGGEWIDLTPKLKTGNNPLRLRIRNDRGTWAYRLSLRINGQTTPLACGTPLRRDDPCTCCGMSGTELGEIDLPPIWLHVDPELGRAEVLP